MARAATPTELANARDIILRRTNEKRIANGRSPLSAWPGLDSVSQHWTQYMAASGNFKHNPDYATQYPSECNGAKAENIAAGQTIESVVEAWWKSPGHKANILDARFTHLGIGYAVNPNDPNKYYRYFTQNFCQQK